MRIIVLLFIVLLLVGCNSLGGISPDLTDAVKNAGAGCVRVDSLVMGKGVVTFANDTRGAIQNGSITVNPETCAITITSTTVSKITPVVTTTTGSSTVTTVMTPQ